MDDPEITDDADTARCRDDLVMKLAALKPMTNAELLARHQAEKGAAQKGDPRKNQAKAGKSGGK
jgi:hypothetical protein